MSDKKSVKDILRPYPKPTDGYLKAIFEAQKRFGGRFCDFNRCAWDTAYRLEWTYTFADCIMDELSEVMNWLPWKHWKNYDDFKTDEIEIRFELIDILHFVVSLYLVHRVEEIDLLYDPVEISNRSALELVFRRVMSQIEEPDQRNKHLATRFSIRDMNMAVGNLQGLTDVFDGEILEMLDGLFLNLLAVMGIWGMNPGDIYSYYMSKNKENFDRQERGY